LNFGVVKDFVELKVFLLVWVSKHDKVCRFLMSFLQNGQSLLFGIGFSATAIRWNKWVSDLSSRPLKAGLYWMKVLLVRVS